MQHKKKYVTYYLQKYENAELLVNFTLNKIKASKFMLYMKHKLQHLLIIACLTRC